MREIVPVRIVIRELDFMPSAERWAVDYCATLEPLNNGRVDYIPMMSRFFESEDVAMAFACIEAVKLGFARVDDRTWRKSDEGKEDHEVSQL